MLETADLILDKAKFSDWTEMYKNVWSHSESAEYMLWKVTGSEEEAKIRINKAIEWQKEHDTYLIYEKKSMKAIGFAGVEQLSHCVYQETGICLGTDYVNKGYGKQVLKRLIKYCEEKGAAEFIYFCREKNEAAKGLANSLGFILIDSEEKTDKRSGEPYLLQKYILKLSSC